MNPDFFSRRCLSVVRLFGLAGATLLAANVQALDGRVIDGSTGKPLAGAMVTLGSELVQTDAEGHYHITTPADRAGKQVMTRAIGYNRNATAVPVEGEQVADLKLHPQAVNGVYLSVYGIGDKQLRNGALDLIGRTELNALVIDVKGDKGLIPYPSQIALAQQIGARSVTTVRDMPAQLQALKDKGVYLIARIVTFKDDPMAKAHPEWAVKKADGSLFRDLEGLAWMDATRKEAWQYPLDVAAEAAAMGFDEIQFDYVRLPDTAGLQFSVDNNEANRTAAINGFLAAAHERLKPYNVFLAADIFGYVAWNENDTHIGQTLDGVAASVDYLCPMLYPSGFKFGIPKYRNPVANSYEIVNHTLVQAIKRSNISPLRYRPWLQAFKDYAFDKRAFAAAEIADQTRAARDAGTSGWLLWNPRNTYSDAGLKAGDSKTRTAGTAPAQSTLAEAGSVAADTP